MIVEMVLFYTLTRNKRFGFLLVNQNFEITPPIFIFTPKHGRLAVYESIIRFNRVLAHQIGVNPGTL